MQEDRKRYFGPITIRGETTNSYHVLRVHLFGASICLSNAILSQSIWKKSLLSSTSSLVGRGKMHCRGDRWSAYNEKNIEDQ